jgi:hypothetical protein
VVLKPLFKHFFFLSRTSADRRKPQFFTRREKLERCCCCAVYTWNFQGGGEVSHCIYSATERLPNTSMALMMAQEPSQKTVLARVIQNMKEPKQSDLALRTYPIPAHSASQSPTNRPLPLVPTARTLARAHGQTRSEDMRLAPASRMPPPPRCLLCRLPAAPRPRRCRQLERVCPTADSKGCS